MSKIVIIRGNSGSGKSTIAKKLQKIFGRNTMLIHQDVIRREMLWVDDNKGTKALPLLIDLIKYGKQNSNITILEGILKSDVYMKLFVEIKNEFMNQVYAYYYDIPFEETVKRHQTKQNRNNFGEEEMKNWWNEKDFIDILEEKIITKDISQEDTIKMIYNDVVNNIT